MAAAAIFNCEKLLPFLHYWTNPHQNWWEYGKFNSKCNHYVKIAYSTKFNVAAAAIMNSEKLLPFLYHSTNAHQIWWEWCAYDIVEKCKFTKSQDGGCRHLELRKTFAIPLLVDLFSPNLVGMLQIRCWIQLVSRKWAQRFHSKMAAAAILNFEKMWLFHYY